MKFNKEKAQAHLDALLKQYGIKVVAYSATSCGRANWRKKEVKIPAPTNADRFAFCMHEVKHIIDGGKGYTFEREFHCDMYARQQMLLIGTGGVEEWDKRVNWHVLSRIAMAFNRGLHIANISAEIRAWFADVDFEKWQGQKVFVRHSKHDPKGYTLELTPNIKQWEIEMLLNRRGLMLEKSEADDSTYGHWIVKANGQRYGSEFTTLAEVIQHYKLNDQTLAATDAKK